MSYLQIDISALPDYEQFSRKTNLRLNPDKIPDLEWELSDKLHTTNIGQVVRPDTRPLKEKDCVTVEIDIIFVNVYSYTYQKIACTSTTYSDRRQPICHVLPIQVGKRLYNNSLIGSLRKIATNLPQIYTNQ